MAGRNLEATVLRLIRESGFANQGLTLDHLHKELRGMEHPECPTKATSPKKTGPQAKLKDLLNGMSSLQVFIYKGEAAFKIKHSAKPTAKVKSEPSDTSDPEDTAMTTSKKAKLQSRKQAVAQGSGGVKGLHGSIIKCIDPSQSKKFKPVKDKLDEIYAAVDDLVKAKRPREFIAVPTSTLQKIQEHCLDAQLLLHNEL